MSDYNILGYIPTEKPLPSPASVVFLNGGEKVYVKGPNQEISELDIEDLPGLIGASNFIMEYRKELSINYSAFVDDNGKLIRFNGDDPQNFLNKLKQKDEKPSLLETSIHQAWFQNIFKDVKELFLLKGVDYGLL